MAQAEKETKEPLKIKKKPGRPKKLSSEDNKVTIDLKPKENAVQEQSTTKVDVNKQTPNVEEVEKREPTAKLEELTKQKVEDKKEDKEVTIIKEKPIVKEEKSQNPLVKQENYLKVFRN